MASPSPQAVAAIRARVSDWTPGDAAVLATLNDPAVANPAPQGQVPAPVSASALLLLLTDPANNSLVKLMNWPNFASLRADIDAQNRPGIGLWCRGLVAAGIVTQGEATAIVSYLGSTVADPAYRPQISWAEANIGRDLTLDDVAASRPGA